MNWQNKQKRKDFCDCKPGCGLELELNGPATEKPNKRQKASNDHDPVICLHCHWEGHKKTNSKHCLKNSKKTAAAAAAVSVEPERAATGASLGDALFAAADSTAMKTADQKAAEAGESHGVQHNKTQCIVSVALFSDLPLFVVVCLHHAEHFHWAGRPIEVGRKPRTVLTSAGGAVQISV